MGTEMKIYPFEEWDSAEVIECLRETYGEDYFHRECYDAQYLLTENREKILQFFVARTIDNTFVGMIGIRRNPYFEGAFEMSSQVMRPIARGKGMGKRLLSYAIQQALIQGGSSVYGRSVTFHNVSQNEMHLFSMFGTGLWFGRHLSNRSFLQNGKNPSTAKKLHSIVTVGSGNKLHTGQLYMPDKIRPFAHMIYTLLNVPTTYMPDEDLNPSGVSDVRCIDDLQSNNCDIYIVDIGSDLLCRIQEIIAERKGRPLQTFNVFIDMLQPCCPFGCRTLEKMGFFFTGLHPLCQNTEYMIFHYLPDSDVLFDELVLSDDNYALSNAIKEFWRESLHMQGADTY